MRRFGTRAAALAAQTENRKMLEVSGKTVFFAQLLIHRLKNARVCLNPLAAIAAEQVVVVRVAMDFILDAPASKVGWVDQIEPCQQVEGAIDARFVDRSISRADAFKDLVYSEMTIAGMDDREDVIARRGQPVPRLAQAIRDFGMMRHSPVFLIATSCNKQYSTECRAWQIK